MIGAIRRALPVLIVILHAEYCPREPDVLSADELKMFFNFNPADITPRFRNRKQVELYYDFCVFMFHSFFAPCDVIKAKWRDITRKNTISVRRKKTHRPVEIPITPVMRKIIDKYKWQSKDGYIFPIMDDEKEKTYNTKDYTYKKFREFLNKWLKVVGKELRLSFDLYAYVFRHTAITVAIDHGLSVSCGQCRRHKCGNDSAALLQWRVPAE